MGKSHKIVTSEMRVEYLAGASYMRNWGWKGQQYCFCFCFLMQSGMRLMWFKNRGSGCGQNRKRKMSKQWAGMKSCRCVDALEGKFFFLGVFGRNIIQLE